MNKQDREIYAVLIDADNILAIHASDILKEAARFGELALRRVYGDWASTKLNQWRNATRELGMVARQQTVNISGKNASDIGLVIDAMDLLHTGRFDGFVLVSSDSDFTALANRLREQGLDVIGIGEDKTPQSLRKAYNRFILIENIISDAITPEPTSSTLANDKNTANPPQENSQSVPAKKTAPTKKSTVAASQQTTSNGKLKPNVAVKLIVEAMDKIEQDNDWYHLGVLGSYIRREHPDFDPRTYGQTKLSDLLKKLSTHFKVEKSNGQLKVRRIKKKSKKQSG